MGYHVNIVRGYTHFKNVVYYFVGFVSLFMVSFLFILVDGNLNLFSIKLNLGFRVWLHGVRV